MLRVVSLASLLWLAESAREAPHLVDVNDGGGKIATGSGQTFAFRSEGPRERILQTFEVVDLDFDGYPDVRVVREWGAKWQTFHVWRYDPRLRRHVYDARLSRLPNLTIDLNRRELVSFTIGPSDPSCDRYAWRNGRLLRTERIEGPAALPCAR